MEKLKQAGYPHADLENVSPSRSLLLNDSLRVMLYEPLPYFILLLLAIAITFK